MRVLFLAGACPYPPDSGGTVRTYNLLKQLCARHQITLISPARPGSDLTTAFGGRLSGIAIAEIPQPGSVRRLAALASTRPYIVASHANRVMRAAVRNALCSQQFDLLHCDSISVVPAVPRDMRIPKVYNAHNVEAVIWERYVANDRRAWMRPILRSQLAKVSRYESRLPRMFDCCAAVSEEDRIEMQRRYGARGVVVVPNGVDLGYYTPLPDPGKPAMVYVGSLDWRPNQDAVGWLLESIWPRVRSDLPGASLAIVGRRPPAWMCDICKQSGVALHADVPDVRPYLASSSLAIVPLRIGGGSRLKILEAMAAGRCVISTSVGAEGLEVTDGLDLVVADDAVVFAAQCVSLLRDRERRQSLAASARSMVEGRYGWDSVALDMEHAWARASRQFGVLETRQ